MSESLAPLFNIYNSTTGRRLFAFMQVRQIAQALGLTDIVTHADRAMEHDKQTRVVEQKWDHRKVETRSGDTARKLDTQIDRILSAIQSALLGAVRAFPAQHADHKAAQILSDKLFPKGLRSHILKSHVDQLSYNDLILETLGDPQYSGTISQRGLKGFVEALETHNTAFRAALDKAPGGPSVTFDVVQAHRSQGQEHLLQLIAKVVGQFSGTSDEDVAARTELLAPVMRQQNAIAGYLRRHRPIPDVDPESGEETDESQVDPVPAHSHTVTLSDTDG